jgi:hypothetical protein
VRSRDNPGLETANSDNPSGLIRFTLIDIGRSTA